MSHFMIPPKMLTKIPLTLGSAVMIRMAAATCSALAPPPTSRKLAGSPPKYLMMSIVAIARPAPLTMQPMLPVELDVGEPGLLGFELGRVLLGFVPHRRKIGMPEEGVVVERHLPIEGHDACPLRHDQRVDLDQVGVEIVGQAGQSHDELDEVGMRCTLEPESPTELVGLECRKSNRRIDGLRG